MLPISFAEHDLQLKLHLFITNLIAAFSIIHSLLFLVASPLSLISGKSSGGFREGKRGSRGFPESPWRALGDSLEILPQAGRRPVGGQEDSGGGQEEAGEEEFLGIPKEFLGIRSTWPSRGQVHHR